MHFKHFLVNNTSELRNYVNIKSWCTCYYRRM